MGVAATLTWKGSRVSRPNQKVGPPGGTFGSTVISKKYFRKFMALLVQVIKPMFYLIENKVTLH